MPKACRIHLHHLSVVERRRASAALCGLLLVLLAQPGASSSTTAAGRHDIKVPTVRPRTGQQWRRPELPVVKLKSIDELAAHPLLRESTSSHVSEGGRRQQPAVTPGDWGACAHGGCKLLAFVAGFGGSELELKKTILRNNTRALVAQAEGVFQRIDVRVACYEEDMCAQFARELNRDETNATAGGLSVSVRVVHSRGLIGHHLAAADPTGYDYVFVATDDAELQAPVPWRAGLALQQLHRLDAVSGCAEAAHVSSIYELMKCDHRGRRGAAPGDQTVVETRFLELQLMLLTAPAFERLQEFLHPDNPTFW
jgi:hypothetical protein